MVAWLAYGGAGQVQAVSPINHRRRAPSAEAEKSRVVKPSGRGNPCSSFFKRDRIDGPDVLYYTAPRCKLISAEDCVSCLSPEGNTRAACL